MTARLAIAAALAATAGCTVTEQVLGDDTSPITTCAEVWSRGFDGAPCSLTTQCLRDDPANPMCCQDFAYCAMGELVLGENCNPDCATCLDDFQCTAGAAICVNGSCEPCMPTDPTGMLCQQTCPMGWTFLARNGCTICQCAPAPECIPEPNMPGPAGCGGLMEQCYPGNPVDPGCHPSDNGCFPSTCSIPGCMEPAPLGCFMPCDTMTMCQTCATTNCECDPTGNWICQPFCIDSTPMNLSCLHVNP